MKAKSNFGKTILDLSAVVCFLIASNSLIAQEQAAADLENFKVILQKTPSGISLQGVQGTAWTELAVRLNNYQPQTIDEFGITDTNRASSGKDTGLTDFLFSIRKTETGIELKGIAGTAWADLSFILAENEQQAIDQYGMVKLN
ncbi:hypothetical protein [Zeaxanthinibacter enoshimensis]|uniref:Uncharacterized protein n=1 Tax=Zeaxanthinibacter enoshimensis TaxID=392009 RepID=A0A4R6TW09_9FLAO|nr:hypothetical protein [Zeaxanthinibacter enoshimensis]TDQ33128.1 hypothetical protein CLV82_0966 [Zeaxanthinibacter enoshimensis]